MLMKIGDRTKKILGIALFVPIIASFLVWGISDMLKAAGVARYAATVGNVTISTQEFDHAYRRQLDGMRRQGIKMDAETARSMGIANNVMRNLIERELLLQATRDYGIRISDQTVAAEIQKETAFYNDAGKFDKEKFKTLLANSGVGEQEFIAGLRGDMAIKLLLASLQESAQPPSELPHAMVVLQKSKYTADVYALPHDAMQGTRAPRNDELNKYYNSHKDHYQKPEMRRGVLATLSLKDWQENLKPTEADLKAIYENQKSDFTIPEERSVQFVSLPDEATAKKVAEAARGGEKLSEAAKMPVKNMELVKPGTLPAELDKAIFKLPRGETSEPVNTPLGWYVMQITNIKAGVTVPMDRIRDKLVAAWRQDQAGAQLPKLLNKLDDGIAGGSSLEELAKTYHLQLRQLPMLDANGQGMDEKISADKTLKEVMTALFKQNSGEVGNVFELSNGDYAVLRVDEVRQAAVPPLAEIKDTVIADWKKSNQRELAEEAARKLANDWRSGDNITAAAQKIGASLTTRADITRDVGDKSQKQLSALERAVLRGGAAGEVITTTDGKTEYVAKIRAITPPAPASVTDAVLGDMRNLASEWVRNDYVQIFLNALEKRYAVEVNENAIKQIENNAAN